MKRRLDLFIYLLHNISNILRILKEEKMMKTFELGTVLLVLLALAAGFGGSVVLDKWVEREDRCASYASTKELLLGKEHPTEEDMRVVRGLNAAMRLAGCVSFETQVDS